MICLTPNNKSIPKAHYRWHNTLIQTNHCGTNRRGKNRHNSNSKKSTNLYKPRTRLRKTLGMQRRYHCMHLL